MSFWDVVVASMIGQTIYNGLCRIIVAFRDADATIERIMDNESS